MAIDEKGAHILGRDHKTNKFILRVNEKSKSGKYGSWLEIKCKQKEDITKGFEKNHESADKILEIRTNWAR